MLLWLRGAGTDKQAARVNWDSRKESKETIAFISYKTLIGHEECCKKEEYYEQEPFVAN